MYSSVIFLSSFTTISIAWVPPGMSERAAELHAEDQTSHMSESHHEGHETEHHHNHNENENVGDLVRDTEHLMDDMGDVYTEDELAKMETDERVFTWFQAHDQDSDGTLDGLELLKALSHDHNYHHDTDDIAIVEEDPHDPAQHTDPAERQRFRRVVKAVDRLLEEDDVNDDGYIDYSEFMAAFTSGKLDKVKIKKP